MTRYAWTNTHQSHGPPIYYFFILLLPPPPSFFLLSSSNHLSLISLVGYSLLLYSQKNQRWPLLPFVIFMTTLLRGTIQDTHAGSRTTGDFHHDLCSTLMPNEIVDAPGLAGDLIRWAQGYLDQIQHAAGPQLVQSAALISNQLDRSQTRNEGTITSLYARMIETWSSEFVASVDNVPPEAIRFEECGQVNGVRSDWKWTRNDKTRMIVEHRGKEVFNNYCHQIRSLATSNASLGFGNSGSITGASSILTKVSATV